jgi:hypothetical protein
MGGTRNRNIRLRTLECFANYRGIIEKWIVRGVDLGSWMDSYRSAWPVGSLISAYPGSPDKP